VTHQLDSPIVVRKVRRDIARIKTLQRQQELLTAAASGR